MLQPVNYHYPSPIQAINLYELKPQIQRVLDGELIGIVIASHCDAFDDSINAAQSLGLNGDTGLPVVFDYDRGFGALTNQATMPKGLQEWATYGVTPLHVDSDLDFQMVSICRIEQGGCEIRIFDKGPDLDPAARSTLREYLEAENGRVLLEEAVDSSLLGSAATCLRASEGDLVIFNPLRPHMGVTTQAPRRSASIFFWR